MTGARLITSTRRMYVGGYCYKHNVLMQKCLRITINEIQLEYNPYFRPRSISNRTLTYVCSLDSFSNVLVTSHSIF